MNENIDLLYDPGSFAGPLDESRLREFEKWLRASGWPNVHFDELYVNHLRQFHGGIPGKRLFKTTTGEEHVIERFLNFMTYGSKSPLGQYSVPSTLDLIDDYSNEHLIPFAELFGGDKLCFDFEADAASVVVLYHELSEMDKPYTEFVAKNFSEFMKMLYQRS